MNITMYQLRDYQELVLVNLFDWFNVNKSGNPIIDMCVGAGKSIVIAELCRRIMQYPNQRVLMAVASRELVAQNYEKLHHIYPQGDMGLYSSGLGKKNPHAKIVFATIGSIYNKAMHTGSFNICIVDECHNINRKDTGMYRKMINDYTRLNPKFRVIGFTGTPFRGNGVLLTEGEEALFTGIAARVSMRDMLDKGYLSPLVLKSSITKVDASGVSINHATGDYNISELSKAVDNSLITKPIIKEIIDAGQNRKSWLIFGVDVAHCLHLHDELKSYGVQGAVVHGSTPKCERDNIINQYKKGRIRYIVNCMVLTVGFDAPATDLIALVRPTKSPVLYVQICGRGMRKADGKTDCLWLDFTDTTASLGAVDEVSGKLEPKIKKSAPTLPEKQCPNCEATWQYNKHFCTCGFEFDVEPVDPKINQSSSNAAILSTHKSPTLTIVLGTWRSNIHYKHGSPASLLVIYQEQGCGNLPFKITEYLCFDHTGFARRKAENWWLKLGGGKPIPLTTAEAHERFGELVMPSAIKATKNGKFYEVLNYVTNVFTAA